MRVRVTWQVLLCGGGSGLWQSLRLSASVCSSILETAGGRRRTELLLLYTPCSQERLALTVERSRLLKILVWIGKLLRSRRSLRIERSLLTDGRGGILRLTTTCN